MEWKADEKEIKAAGGELLSDGLRIHGWEIQSSNRSCLTSLNLQSWEEKLETSHLPEMIFGDSFLVLKHMTSGTKIHFNAFDALVGWKKERLPPVEVPAAAQWKFRSKPFEQIILDYDYTFTTPYSGSETVETSRGAEPGGNGCLKWEECEEQINVAALASKEPILFYDEVILYEYELADNALLVPLAKKFEIRLLNLSGARAVLGKAIGIAPKDKIFKKYIEIELQLVNIDRVPEQNFLGYTFSVDYVGRFLCIVI